MIGQIARAMSVLIATVVMFTAVGVDSPAFAHGGHSHGAIAVVDAVAPSLPFQVVSSDRSSLPSAAEAEVAVRGSQSVVITIPCDRHADHGRGSLCCNTGACHSAASALTLVEQSAPPHVTRERVRRYRTSIDVSAIGFPLERPPKL